MEKCCSSYHLMQLHLKLIMSQDKNLLKNTDCKYYIIPFVHTKINIIFLKKMTSNFYLKKPRKVNNLSYFHNSGKEQLLHFTIGNLVEQSATKYGDNVAIASVYDNRKITYKEILIDADKLAAGFLKLRLRTGDRVGLWAPNIIEWVVIMAAAARAGLITVAFNPVYELHDLEYSLNKVGVKAVVCLETYKNLRFYEMLCTLCPEIVNSEPGQLESKKAPLLKTIIIISNDNLRGVYTYASVLNIANDLTVEFIKSSQNRIQASSPALIQFSSGTTGKPKAACVSHYQLFNNSYEAGKRSELNENHIVLVQTPFFHVFGLVSALLSAHHFGNMLVTATPIYSSSANLNALETEKCTMVNGTPTMFIDLISRHLKVRRLNYLKVAVVGGASSSPQLLKDIKQTFNLEKVKSAYGLTEVTCICFHSTSEYEDDEKETNSVGYLVDHLEAKIVDENDQIVPFETPGELCVRGYSVMLGYWDDEQKTKEVITCDRWFKTGDQFVLLQNGYGRVVGRLKDMISRGGENVFPKEIEDVLSTHPDILENYVGKDKLPSNIFKLIIQVIGLAHQRLGEEVCACVRLKPEANIDIDALIMFCEGKLTKFKVPTQLRIVDDFPKTTWKSKKISYIHNVGKEPLLPLTTGKLVEQSALKYGDKTAIVSVYDNRKITFDEILSNADKLAVGILNMGLNTGDRIGLWAPNVIEWVVTLAAAARAGLIVVALNPTYQGKELEYSIKKVGMKALVCFDAYKNLKFYETLCEVIPDIASYEPGQIQSPNVPSLKSVITISDSTLSGTYNYKGVLENANNSDVKNIKKMQDKIKIDSPAQIQFSSGTTGIPKAACLSHFQLVNNSYIIGKRTELNKEPHSILIQVPLFHVFGIVASILPSFHFGTTLVFPAPMYNSTSNLRALETEQCSVVYGTPTMFVDLVNLQKKEKKKLNPTIGMTGGSVCSPYLFKLIKDVLKLKRIKSIYGLSEATCVSFQSLSKEEGDEEAMNSVGYVGDHLEAKVVDPNGNIVPIGTPGELCIRGYNTMLGYWEDEENTKEVMDSDKWLKTGDQFIIKRNGYGNVVGRIKDMIIRGGENIFPKEIEDLLNTHPVILENHVIGLPNERLGEEVCACVRIQEGSHFDHDSLIKFCKGKIANYKIPTQLRIVTSFPKTTSGKIQKFLLKKQFQSNKIS
ncbi:hypothetical protein FQA39_LY09121 [Lamprigera yunnana]|nr:hypothetical protein FQA39_LY09121 [Lamprigera yunnana]